MTRTRNTKAHKGAAKAKTLPPNRDITSYVTKMMLSGNIAALGIPRADIEKALTRYCIENPKIDATALPLVGMSVKMSGDVAKAVIALAEKYCGRRGDGSAIVAADRKSVIIFGASAKEIVSKAKVPADAEVEHLKTKIKVECPFPVNRTLRCFGGKKVCDCVKLSK